MTKNFVQIGRVAIINSGPEKGKFAVIANVIDHKRVLIDSPKTADDKYTSLKRQAYSTRHLRIMKYRLSMRPDETHNVISDLWSKHKITQRLLSSKYMVRKLKQEKKENLTDFDRFKLYKLKQRTNRVLKQKVRALRDRWGKPTETKDQRKKRLSERKTKKTVKSSK